MPQTTETHNEEFDLGAAIRAELEALNASKKPQAEEAAPTAPSAAPIEIELDGQPYKFNSPQELSAAIKQFRDQAAREIESARRQPLQAEKATAQGDDAPKWSQDKFVELMKEDVRKAFEYVDSHRFFNGKVENASQAIREQLEQAATVQKALAIEQFRQAHPEFPISHVGATQFVEQVRQELNLPYNPQGLEAAYLQAYNRNPQFRQVVDQNYQHLTSPAPKQEEVEERKAPFYTPPRSAQANPYLAAPPSTSRTTVEAPLPYKDDDLESLSADQIEKIISRMHRSGK